MHPTSSSGALPFMTQRDLLVGRERYPWLQRHREPFRHKAGHGARLSLPLFARAARTTDNCSEWIAAASIRYWRCLRARRLDYGISNELSLHWFNRQSPAKPALIALQVGSGRTHCVPGTVRSATCLRRRVLRAMVRLQQRGEFDSIAAALSLNKRNRQRAVR